MRGCTRACWQKKAGDDFKTDFKMEMKLKHMTPFLCAENRRIWGMSVLLTLAYGALFVFSEFYKMPYGGLADLASLAFQWCVVELSVLGLIYFLMVFRWLFAVAFPLLTAACTVLAYFRYTAQVTLTPMIIDLAMVNDARTSLDVVSVWLILAVALSLVASALAVRQRLRMADPRPRWVHMIISLAMLCLPPNIPAASHAVRQRMPLSIYYATEEYLDNQRLVAEERPEFRGKAACGSDSLTVVFILGESLRASNMQINGYGRATTPLLCAEKNAVSLPNVYSDYYLTHTSVPHLLTRSDERHPGRAFTERSFISLMKQAGYRTTWIANQESVETFVYFMKECDSLIYVNGGKNLYIYDLWLDGDVLPAYDKELARSGARKFILIHTIGSHWFYNAHYPKEYERFKPVIKSKVISSNTAEQMRNSYDNTVLYSDHVWHELINRLRNRNAILIYLSDHAENLGEDGYFTHGADRPELHRPGCFVWYSDEFARRYPQKVKALRANRDRNVKSYFLFHTILDAADIRSNYIEGGKDLLKQK